MGAFIKRHWLAYIIAVVVAILLGVGASYFVGVKGSTPESVREERDAERDLNDARDKAMEEELSLDRESSS